MIGFSLAGAALVVYLTTLSPGAVPGESAGLVVRNSGLVPNLLPTHPVWGSITWLVSHVPFGGLALRLNVFSAICGALSVWLLYAVMARAVEHVIDPNAADQKTVRIAGHIAGVVSAGAFAFCAPFWIVSNRAATASFDVLLLLAAAWLLVRYAADGRRSVALILAFLFGVGCVESIAFIALSPLIAVSFLYIASANGNLRTPFLLQFAVAFVAGLSLYLVSAFIFQWSAGYLIAGYSGFFAVFLTLLRQQYMQIMSGLPREGWLLVHIMTTIPWLTCLSVARRGLTGEKDRGFYLLHVVIAAIAAAVILETVFSPLHVTGRLMVTPYLLASSCLGYAAAYWFMQPKEFSPREDEPRAARLLRLLAGPLLCLPFAVVVCIAPFRNLGAADGRKAGFLDTYVREIVDSMEGRKWLITDGDVDEVVLIAARDAGRSLVPLNARGSGNDTYMKYVSTLFPEPRLKNMAQIGMLPLVQDWLRSDPDVSSKIASISNPDPFAAAGMLVVPNKLVFFGGRTNDPLDTTKLMSEHIAFWNRCVPFFKRAASERSRDRRGLAAACAILRQIAMVANNLGVLMQDLGREADAFTAYSKAYEIDANNMSAALNLAALLDKGYGTDSGGILRKQIDDLLSSPRGKDHVWELAKYYGYVRSPEGVVREGLKWARSGQLDLAVAWLAKREALLAGAEKSRAEAEVAGICLSSKRIDLAEHLYNKMLDSDPRNHQAIMGLARIAIGKGDLSRAAELLGRAAAAGADKSQIALETASMETTAGHPAKAAAILRELVELQPNLLRAWSMLAEIMAGQKDLVALDDCFQHMERLAGGRPLVSGIKAQLALRNRDMGSARRSFEETLILLPGNFHALEQLLRLDLMEGKTEYAQLHARSLLRLNPGHPLANYAIGHLQLNMGEIELAEDSLRRSLAGEKTAATLNDLAWLLQARGDYPEAERLTREALTMNDKMPQVWDTLGVALFKSGSSNTNRLAEAEQAFEKALSLAPDGPFVCLHMAELQAMKGEKEKARELVRKALAKRKSLPAAEQKELKRLAKSLGVKVEQ